MPAPLEFYFDFSSPYGYLGSRKIEALAAKYGRGVDWRPILLGVVFKHAGTAPLVDIPLKGDYSRRDMSAKGRPECEYRSAQREGSPMSTAGPPQGARTLLRLGGVRSRAAASLGEATR